MAATMSCNAQNSKKMEYNKLTPQEERVLLHKATDMPFTGLIIKKRMQELIYAGDVMHRFTKVRISLIQVVAGPALMTK